MQNFVKVRNSLMHPKRSKDLEVDEESLVDMFKAATWFGTTVIDIFTPIHHIGHQNCLP